MEADCIEKRLMKAISSHLSAHGSENIHRLRQADTQKAPENSQELRHSRQRPPRPSPIERI